MSRAMDFYLLAKEWVKKSAVSIARSFLTPQKVNKGCAQGNFKKSIAKATPGATGDLTTN